MTEENEEGWLLEIIREVNRDEETTAKRLLTKEKGLLTLMMSLASGFTSSHHQFAGFTEAIAHSFNISKRTSVNTYQRFIDNDFDYETTRNVRSDFGTSVFNNEKSVSKPSPHSMPT